MTPGDFQKNQYVKIEKNSHVTSNDNNLYCLFQIQFVFQSDSFTCFTKLARVYQLY